MFSRHFFRTCTICFVAIAQILFSQITIQGTVEDNGGEYLGNGTEPVSNALVSIIDQSDTSRVFDTFTNELGQYSVYIDQTSIHTNLSVKPVNFRLKQNYPNPFMPSTVIGFELSKPSYITIEVFNILGRKVKTLFDGYQNSSGQVIWDATNDHNQRLPSGLYIYSMKVGDHKINKTMLLLDGQTCDLFTIQANSQRTLMSVPNDLCKIRSNQYILRITGNNIETYVKQNLEINDNISIDIKVNRTVSDQDGSIYKTIKIGDQWWMMENLKVTHYRNGDPIENVTDNMLWMSLTTGAWCAYDNDLTNAENYGLLYNWHTVNDFRNIAPEGWHIPSDEEWKQLEMHMGMSRDDADDIFWRGTNEGSKLTGNAALWENGDLKNNVEFGASGFSALPGGYRYYFNSRYFQFLGYHAYFWSSTEYNGSRACARYLTYNDSSVGRNYYNKENGFSVRCIRD